MTITSYAQNFEDVILWRALGDAEHGVYIDVGAQDPVVDSVSRAFHEQGWRGIHIEPTPHYAELLRQQRPSDLIVQAALSNEPSPHTLLETSQANAARLEQEIVRARALAQVLQTAGECARNGFESDLRGLQDEHALAIGEVTQKMHACWLRRPRIRNRSGAGGAMSRKR